MKIVSQALGIDPRKQALPEEIGKELKKAVAMRKRIANTSYLNQAPLLAAILPFAPEVDEDE